MHAYGKYVGIEVIASEESSTASGIIIPPSKDKRRGGDVKLWKGKVLSIGHTAAKAYPDLAVGDIVLFNPYDMEKHEEGSVVDCAAIFAKIHEELAA